MFVQMQLYLHYIFVYVAPHTGCIALYDFYFVVIFHGQFEDVDRKTRVENRARGDSEGSFGGRDMGDKSKPARRYAKGAPMISSEDGKGSLVSTDEQTLVKSDEANGSKVGKSQKSRKGQKDKAAKSWAAREKQFYRPLIRKVYFYLAWAQAHSEDTLVHISSSGYSNDDTEWRLTVRGIAQQVEEEWKRLEIEVGRLVELSELEKLKSKHCNSGMVSIISE